MLLKAGVLRGGMVGVGVGVGLVGVRGGLVGVGDGLVGVGLVDVGNGFVGVGDGLVGVRIRLLGWLMDRVGRGVVGRIVGGLVGSLRGAVGVDVVVRGVEEPLGHYGGDTTPSCSRPRCCRCGAAGHDVTADADAAEGRGESATKERNTAGSRYGEHDIHVCKLMFHTEEKIHYNCTNEIEANIS